MAHVLRLIAALLCVLPLSTLAAGQCEMWRATLGSRTGSWAGSPEAAVMSLAAVMPTTHQWSDCRGSITYSYGGVNDWGEHVLKQVFGSCTNSNGYTGGESVATPGVSMSRELRDCPYEDCPVGFERGSDGQCRLSHRQQCYVFAGVETIPGGALVQDYALSGNVPHGATFCMPLSAESGLGAGAGCRVEFDRSMLATNTDGSSTSYGTYSINIKPNSGVVNGVPDYTCTAGDGSTTGANKPTEAPCKNGSPGTVNGVTVCVPRQSDNGVTTDTEGTETKTNSDGSTTTTKTNKQTTCAGDVCTTTTTTTTTNSGGGAPVVTSITTTGSKADYCKANATAVQCTGNGTGGNGDGEGDDKSSFGGSCAGGFTCEGDAIQCAIAREQHVRACKLFDDPSPESQLYSAEKGKEGDVTADLPGNSTIAFGTDRYDASNALGVAPQCMQDFTIEMFGKPVALPFSKVCDSVAWLRLALLAIGAISWMVIVFRG